MTKEWINTQGEIFEFAKEGDTLEGVLIKVNDGKFLRTDKKGQSMGKSKVYTIESDGKTYTVFGTSVLENRMSGVTEGDSVKIVFNGITTNSLGQDMKLFDVYFKPK